MPDVRPQRSARSLQTIDVFLGFLCLYLVTAGRSLPFGDARPMWMAAQSLVRHGTFAITMRWPVNAPPGSGGLFYPVAALLPVLVHVPGALLQAGIAAIAPARAPFVEAGTSQIAPLFLGALVPALYFRLLRQLGYARRAVAWTTLMLGLGTSVWVYAHRPYSEIVQVVCFLLFFGSLLRCLDAPTRRALLQLGLAASLLINSKNIYFVCLPGAALLVVAAARRRADLRLAQLMWGAVGFAPGLLAFALYNLVRWGSPFRSGYEAVTTNFWTESVFTGLWGPLFSLGKSIFLFSPPLILALFGWPALVRRRPRVAWVSLATVAPVLLVYSHYLFWSGDWGWGARYWVFALPILLLPLAELFEPGRLGRRLKVATASVLMAGVAVQVLGTAFVWDDFINISRNAQHAWLGTPDTKGTVLAPYTCHSCFEEVYPIQWLPSMQPIAGHWWLLRHKAAGHDWRTAEADAPWKRYTSLTADIQEPYEAAGIDWWPFGVGAGEHPIIFVVALLALGVIPIRPWVTELKEPGPERPE